MSSCPELDEIRAKARHGTDISDHLETLFIESMMMKPKLIVELGVRTGESTFAFERAAKLCDSFLVSIDIEPQQTSSSWHKWFFVEADDVSFADRFVNWCKENGIPPTIDVLFIDTNHEYNHTKQEIAQWFPLLSDASKVLFHDANVRMLYKRRDGTIGKAYDDDRDIMRAIEEHVGARFDETKDFVDLKNSWLIRHQAICNGMTILQKIS